MAFSMHSHSGQFCPGHAVDTLEEVIQTAIAHGMKTFGLTEHMPRDSDLDLYPEEESISPLLPRHALYLQEASRLRTKYAPQISILIGFEGEWIRPSYGPFIQSFASNTDPKIDYFIGSVHHVHGIPIDYDAALYAKAMVKAGNEEKLFKDYFDAQYEMLSFLKPKVVGHFDLIRLLSSDPNKDIKTMSTEIWEKIERNLKLVVEQGGLLEVNSAGLRKGLNEPYPMKCIVERFMDLGGKLTLSDDSHGISHVGTNYVRTMEYLERLGVEEVWTLERVGEEVRDKKVLLKDVRESFRP